jgi:hypothetical protein
MVLKPLLDYVELVDWIARIVWADKKAQLSVIRRPSCNAWALE